MTTTLKAMLQKHIEDEKKRYGLVSDPSDLAVELVKLDAERDAVERKKAAEEKAASHMAKMEAVRIKREADAMKEAQQAAAQDAYQWMKVFSALSDRGMEPNKIMDAIKAMQDMGHSAETCLEMIEKTEGKKPPVQPKPPEPAPPPRPEAFGTWA